MFPLRPIFEKTFVGAQVILCAYYLLCIYVNLFKWNKVETNIQVPNILEKQLYYLQLE